MEFDEYVNTLKRKIKTNQKEILFICIGTSKVLGDSIGPLVGSYLKEKIGSKKVLGDINHNICSKKDLIFNYPKIKNKYIVAIDTAISCKDLSGKIFISQTPITMGLALNKNKGKIGDISIKTTICDLEFISKQYVNKMSEFIGKGIYNAIYLNSKD